MNKTTKKIILNYVLGPLLLAVLLFLIYRQVTLKGSFDREWSEFKIHWQDGNRFLIWLVVLLAPVNWIMEARKWQLLLRKIEPLPFRKALASTLTGISFGLITPNRIGDFAGRILYLKHNARLRGAIATLISNLAQTVVAFAFGIIGLVYFNFAYRGGWPAVVLVAALGGTAVLLYFYLRIDILSRWIERFPRLRSLGIAFRVLRKYSKRDLLKVLGIALIRFCIYNLQFLTFINVFGAGIPWLSGFFLTGLMFWMLTMLPSIFIADLGVRGFVAGLIFTDTGIAANAVSVLAGSYFIWFLNLVIPAIIGSFLLLTIRIFR